MTESTERAVLAGGCFWGMQDLLRRYPGVISTRVGYSGGDVKNATYRNHGSHAEAIEIIFDPQQLSYRKLLEFFFQIHDPSTKNRQGNDRGDELSFGDLLHERRAEARRRRDDRRRRCVGHLARQGDERTRARGRFLGSRARASGLSRTLSVGLHVSLHPPELDLTGSGASALANAARAVTTRASHRSSRRARR